MKKNFKYYALIWLILLVVWCTVVFLVRSFIPGFTIRYDARFWVAFVFILLAFLGNIGCAFFAFKSENLNKVFLNIPLITISWSSLIGMLIIGSILMLIPNFPAWVTAIICIIAFSFNAVSIISVSWAADTVNNVDVKVKSHTAFIKNLTVDADSILARAKSDPVKDDCKKVYEAIRYSDPMSNEALSVIEAKITIKMDEFSNAVNSDDVNSVKQIADELLLLVGDRNKKCKALK